MNQFEPIVIDFEGKPVTTYRWSGRLAWIASEIAVAIGSARLGKRLFSQIKAGWADAFIPGHDFDLITGDDLSAFAFADPGDADTTADRDLILLYEPGLHLALAGANEAGRRLRLHLMNEVLPFLVDEPEEEVPFVLHANGAPAEARRRAAYDPRTLEEPSEHALDRDLDDRKFRVATLHRTADLLRDFGRLDDDQRVLLEVSACEIALGFPLIHLYPPPVRDAVARALGMPVEADSEEPVTAAA